MSNNDISIYKTKIMSLLIQNEDIVKTIDSKDFEDADDLLYTHIFPYPKIPNIDGVTNTYITMKLDTTDIMANDIYKNFVLTIYILSHESLMKTKYGTRIDVLGGLVIDTLAWRDDIGFDLELSSDVEDVLKNSYHMRELVFKTITPNSVQCGRKIN